VRTLRIQIHPDRLVRISTKEAVERVVAVGSSCMAVTRHRVVSELSEPGAVNVDFLTHSITSLWAILSNALADEHSLQSLSAASMILCEGANGWNDYLLLHHYDPKILTVTPTASSNSSSSGRESA
jgi:hypothetical protein